MGNDERKETAEMARKQGRLLRQWHSWELGQTPVPEKLDLLYTARLLEDAAAWIESDVGHDMSADLAMLVMKLLRHVPDDKPIKAKAIEYLQRNKLSSPLRESV